MIETLRIERLAVVEEAELEFGPALNVLTGETGAGKSLVLGALALLAGGRASPEAVRSGADQAVVEASFRTAGLAELERELAARGLEAEEGELIVRRSVPRAGRGRARIGGALVPVSVLGELLQGRLEISSQHESQALRRPEAQGRLLDAHGGLLEIRERVEVGVRGLRELDAEIARLRDEAEERARREDFLAFQVKEIDAAAVEPGEHEGLRRERERLRHAERLREDADAAVMRLRGDPAGSDAPAAVDLLVEAARRVEGLARIDDALTPLAERLQAAAAEASDAAGELERLATGLEDDPGRLAQLEERLQQLELLQRKYGASEEEILAFRDGAAHELAQIGGADARLEKLVAERGAALEALTEATRQLSRGRGRAARSLSKAVEDGLGALALTGARFEVALEPAPAEPGLPCSASGAERPEFRFAADGSGEPRPIRRVASGGELSRLFLALKNALRSAGRAMVLVFDEVDAGIGGRAADRVGDALARLASEHQVLCITHLPQVAARADTHFRVVKDTGSGAATARVERLDQAGRVEELARMAGGETVTAATRRHARELLRAGRRA